MRKKFSISLLILLCTICSLHAEPLSPYYVPREWSLPRMNVRGGADNAGFWQSRAVHIGFGLMASGAVVAFADNDIRSVRNDFIPAFRHRYDDYLQFSPAAIMLGLKAFGVEGRSEWGEMVVADAFSMAVMLAAVNGIKYGVGRLRPDGSAYNSFPSGHTAMAFTAATMLHLEYGHLSPWVSVAGYSLATATGISRMLNNRHWLSDVVVGAGIGILSTKLGYLISDAIFRPTIRPVDELHDPFAVLDGHPSFLSIGIGRNFLPSPPPSSVEVSPSGLSLTVEGAWFFSRRLGLGAELGIDRFAACAAMEAGRPDHSEPINSVSLLAGGHFSFPLSDRWHAGGKIVAGALKNRATVRNSADQSFTVDFDNDWHFSATAGASVRFMAARNLGFRLFADLNAVPTGYSFNAAATTQYSYPITVGIAVDAMLW